MLIAFNHNDTNFNLEVDDKSDFGRVKELVAKHLNVYQESFTLNLDGVEISDDLTVQESNISFDSTIQVVDEKDPLLVLYNRVKKIDDLLDNFLDNVKFDKVEIYHATYEILCSYIDRSYTENRKVFVASLLELFHLSGDENTVGEILFKSITDDDDFVFSYILDKKFPIDFSEKYRLNYSSSNKYNQYLDLLSVAIHTNPKHVKRILECSDEFDYNTALCVAARENKIESVKMFIDKVTNFETRIDIVDDDESHESYDWNYQCAASLVIKNNNIEFFRLLLDHGLDPINSIECLSFSDKEFILELSIRGYFLDCIKVLTGIEREQLIEFMKTALSKV